MRFEHSKQFPGWIYDNEMDDHISPKGRIAYTPGDPFQGQVSEQDLVLIKQAADNAEKQHDESIKESEDVTIQGHEVELVKTYTVGDITVNVFKAV